MKLTKLTIRKVQELINVHSERYLLINIERNDDHWDLEFELRPVSPNRYNKDNPYGNDKIDE